MREASVARVAWLAGRTADEKRFTCPPCGESCDSLPYRSAGECRACGMELREAAH